MLYLRWCGAALMLIFALFCGREYSAYAERRSGEGRAVLSLLAHIEKMIDSYLSPHGELFLGFNDEWLEGCGFLAALRSGEGLASAFSSSQEKMLLSEGVKKRLSDYFSDFGKGYKEAELKRLRDCRADIEKMLLSEGDELKKSVKVARALLLGGAVGIAILII